MFDAGAIESRLTVDTSQFNRDMDAAEARVKRLTDDPHRVKISAVFDDASTSKARQAFSQLDNAISKDAMSRLRSSPNGSVLGALNALFSPHPVTGAPSPQQSAQQGLLGKILSQPGGGGTPGPSSSSSSSSSSRSGTTVGQILGSNTPGNTSSTNTVRNNIVGAPQNTTTTNRVNVIGAPTNNAITTKDRVSVVGLPVSGGTITTTVKTKLDPNAARSTTAAAQANGDQAGKGWARSFLSSVGGLFGGGGGGGGSSGGKSGGSAAAGFAGNLGGGIGPGILGLGLKSAGIVGLGGAGIGAIPALLGGVAPLLPAALGAGALGALFSGAQSQISPVSQAITAAKAAQAAAQTPAQAQAASQQLAGANAQLSALSPGLQSIYKSEQQISNWWQGFTGHFAPMFAGPLKQVASLLQGLTGPLTNFFKSAFTLAQPLIAGIGDLARQWLPLLAQGFRAAAPVIRPLIDGIGALVSGLLPGLNTLVKASAPAVAALAHIFGELGSSLGQMLAIFAPVLSQSSIILKALFDVVSALFPIIGHLAAIFATALAPVFVQLAGVVKALLPFLTLVGNVLASLAGAVLGDLVSAFGALAQLLQAIAPSLTVFAKAISSVFTVLENTGVFAILGDALEGLVGPLAVLINALIKGLVPVLGPLINFIGQLSALIAAQLAAAIAKLLPPLTELAVKLLGVLAQLLPVILPLLLSFAGVFTQGVVDAIAGVAVALSAIINAIPVPVLSGIVLGVLALVGALKAMALVSALGGGLSFLTTLRLIPGVVSAVTVSIGQMLVKYAVMTAEMVAGAAVQVASWVATAAAATAAFIAENAAMLGIGVAIAALIAAIVYMATHWQQVWTDIKNWTDDAWHWVYSNVFTPLINWFTQSLPHAFDQAISFLKSVFVTPWEQQWDASWAFLKNIGAQIGNFFTVTLPGWFKDVIRFLVTYLVDPWEVNLRTAWSVLQTIGSDIGGFFTKTLPGYFDTAISFMNSHFVTPFQNGLRAAYNWVVTNVVTPLGNLFTKTIPSAFSTAVSAVSSLWGKIEGVVLNPVRFVVNNVLDPLINLFDDVTQAVGLNRPIPVIKLARGGKLPGYGGGDVLPALLEPGETVIDKDKTSKWGWLFKMMGVPGFAAGGTLPINPNQGIHNPGNISQSSSLGNVIGHIIGGATDIGKAVLAIATGNPTALTNAILAMFGKSSSGGMGGIIGQALLGMPALLVKDFTKWIMGTNNSATSQAGGGSTSLHPTGSGATVQALMRSMAASVGWTGAEWTALNNVEMAEAGYNLNAQNPTSNAYGLAQFINGASEYAQYGGNSTTAAGQIIAMLNYIKQRYGDPIAAWAHESAFHWYGNGGTVTEPVLGYGAYSGDRYVFGENGTEVVSPIGKSPWGNGGGSGGSVADILDRLDTLIGVTGAVPAGVGRHVGGTINNAAFNASFRSRYPRGGS